MALLESRDGTYSVGDRYRKGGFWRIRDRGARAASTRARLTIQPLFVHPASCARSRIHRPMPTRLGYAPDMLADDCCGGCGPVLSVSPTRSSLDYRGHRCLCVQASGRAGRAHHCPPRSSQSSASARIHKCRDRRSSGSSLHWDCSNALSSCAKYRGGDASIGRVACAPHLTTRGSSTRTNGNYRCAGRYPPPRAQSHNHIGTRTPGVGLSAPASATIPSTDQSVRHSRLFLCEA